MGVCECLETGMKRFIGWVSVRIEGKGLGMAPCDWAMDEGDLAMGICESLGPWVKEFREWLSVRNRDMGEQG